MEYDEIKQMSNDELFKSLEECCRSHDWYFRMTDDHSVWKRGLIERADIEIIMSELSDRSLMCHAIEIYNKYKPEW